MNERAPSRLALGPALDFLQRLWRLDHATERASARMERRLGITAQQRFVIRCVGAYPGMTAGQLATLLHVDRGTVSATLGRLETKGLLERRRDPVDSRRVVLGLTAKGRALDVPAKGTVEEAVDRMLASTSKEAVLVVAEVLERLAIELDREAP
ncbi:MAG: MarR family transcriptional regulator [Myxococcales bacterium]|nr:MarR family transcriptional regulator [Myxococcales bacterium]